MAEVDLKAYTARAMELEVAIYTQKKLMAEHKKIIRNDRPNPMPSSSNVNVYDEWNKDWINIAFEEVIKRWRKE